MPNTRQQHAHRPRILLGLLAVLAMLAGLIVTAGSAQALAPVVFVNGGTGAPASTLGPYTMTPFGPDGRAAGGTNIGTTVPSPTGGTLTFDTAMDHYQSGGLLGGFGGANTDVYGADNGTATVTLTLPAGTSAFYLYAMTDMCSGGNLTATTDNGTSSGPIPVTVGCGNNQPNNFGFYTSDGSAITSITVTSDNGRAMIGEFGIVAPPAAPTITSASTTTFITGQANSFTVTTSGGSPLPAQLSISTGCLPAAVTFTDNGNGTATIAGNPALSAAGSYSCTITAANGDNSLTSTQSFTLWVRPPAAALPSTEPTYANGSLGGVPMLAQHGSTITVSGSGFAPYAPITLGIYDYYGRNLAGLGSAFADGSGHFSAVTLPIPSSTVYRGRPADVVASGVTAPSGTPRLLRTSMTVF